MEMEKKNFFFYKGYHRVTIGEKFKDGRYQVIGKVGWGHFSTVWLVTDLEYFF